MRPCLATPDPGEVWSNGRLRTGRRSDPVKDNRQRPGPGPTESVSCMSNRPVIGIPSDRRMIGPHPFHAVGEKYIAAVVQAADCLPLLIPVLDTPLDVTEILARVDGIFFPGSPSNVEPHHYKGASSIPGTLH